ncbi:10944_t:CDS:1, partial [Funneliformis caledonium]
GRLYNHNYLKKRSEAGTSVPSSKVLMASDRLSLGSRLCGQDEYYLKPYAGY